jgi:hypothetical protein
MSKAGLKAGLIGGAIVAVLQLVEIIPISCVGFFICLLGWATYVGAGVLAAYWLPIPRSAGDGAGAGAIAGVVAGILGGIFGMIVSAIQFALLGGAEAVAQIPQEIVDILEALGLGNMDIDPGMLTGGAATIVSMIGFSVICCIGGMVIAAVLGAIGGAVFASAQSE